MSLKQGEAEGVEGAEGAGEGCMEDALRFL